MYHPVRRKFWIGSPRTLTGLTSRLTLLHDVTPQPVKFCCDGPRPVAPELPRRLCFAHALLGSIRLTSDLPHEIRDQIAYHVAQAARPERSACAWHKETATMQILLPAER